MSKRPKRRGGFCLVGPIGGPAIAGGAPTADTAPRIGAGAGAPHDAIAARAREIWEVKGCPEDRDLEIWLAAEREMSVRRK
jgi:hypothetical protein